MNKQPSLSLALCLTLLALAASSAPLIQAAVPSPTDQTRFKSALQPFVDRHELAGAVVLVADRNRIRSLESVGYADITAKRSLRPDALFWIASMTKSFTATALMILVDQGKLQLDDPVEKFLPEFKNQWLAVEQDKDHLLLKKPIRRITVRNLLSHTSGLPHFSALENPMFAATGTFGPSRVLPLQDAVRSYAMTPLQFEPGSKWQYCNAGINTAGRIIEIVSGVPYEVFLKQHLFHPLGMKDTTFSPNTRQLARLAKSYKPSAGNKGLEETSIPLFDYALDGRKNLPVPAGGLFSTANDLARFCQMLLNGGVFQNKRIVSQAAIAEMTRKQAETNDSQGYGLGWFSNPDGSFGHNGAFSTIMTIHPGRDLITLFLVQHAGFPGEGSTAYETFSKIALRQSEQEQR